MKLKRVEINNFRSIKSETIEFPKNFQILVGINESGKSNIIKALSLLGDNNSFSVNDIRDPSHEESRISDTIIKFIFKLEKVHVNKVISKVEKSVLCNSIDKHLLSIGDKPYSLREFIRYKDEILRMVNITKDSRYNAHWRLNGPRFRVSKVWKKFIKDSVGAIGIGKDTIQIEDYKFVNTEDFQGVPSEFLEPLEIKDINDIVGSYILEVAKDSFPECIVWKYSEDNLLPGRINLSSFTADPDICIPLKNMFSLAGYWDATKALNGAEEKTNGIKNILKKVGQNTTAHMKKVWPEWKKLEITLNQNGEFIEAGIEDEYNFYSLDRRSDGFKRFLTFLLIISAQSKTEDIYNNIILIDEPDIGLHPSGVQYLRDELKKISTNNIVLISTHSIFMVDKEIVNRHLIVEKDKEQTSTRRVESSNITDEEVIYKALGYSVYDLLKPNNIIFEGWRDKKIFEIFIRSNAGKKLFTKEMKSKIGLLHALGVKDIPRLSNMCENFSRNYIIISDSDQPAKEKQKAFEGSGNWLCYNDIDNVEAITTEDFLPNRLINKAVKTVLSEDGVNTDTSLGNEVTNNKITTIEKSIKKIKNDKKASKELMNSIKEFIVENTKTTDISTDYHKVVEETLSFVDV